MDYRKSAQEVLDNIGGADNVVSAAHCATRLRLVIADNVKVDKEALENIDGAKGVFEAQGQLQIIFGTGTVNKVYDEFIALSGVEAATKAEVKEAAAQQQNIFMRAIKVLRRLCPHHPRHRGFGPAAGHYERTQLYGLQRLYRARHQ